METTLSSPPLTPIAELPQSSDVSSPSSQETSFDIVAKYRDLIRKDPSLTPPIAAIESLIALLQSTPATTVSETLDLLQHSSATLQSNIRNPIPLSAGTDLFQRYLVTTLQRPGSLGPGGDFNLLRQHLISNSKLFVRRAKEARTKIATHALPFIRDDLTVLTYGPSRVINTLLTHAAEKNRHFNVIYISPSPSNPSTSALLHNQVSSLRTRQIPVATIPSHATAYALTTIRSPVIILTGASAVLENGGCLSALGTHQLALLAKTSHRPFYVAAESYKFVRMYPLGQTDLPGLKQDVVKFTTSPAPESRSKKTAEEETYFNAKKEPSLESESEEEEEEMIDVTPPDLISALITENGVMTPSAVSEELIKLWF